MKIFTLIVLLGMALLFNSSCTETDYSCEHEGSGKLTQDERDVNQFDKIYVKGIGTIYITQIYPQKLIVETDDNLLTKIKTKVLSEQLIIDLEDDICPTELNFYIDILNLEHLQLSGSGTFNFNDSLDFQKLNIENSGSGKFNFLSFSRIDNLKIDISGSGDLDFFNLISQSIEIDISGSGDVEALGSSDNVRILIDGSGNIDFSKLITKSADITIEGSGDIRIIAEKTLDIKIYGSGNVYYYGDPVVSSKITGSGKVIKVN